MDALDRYLAENSTPVSPALDWLEKQTHLRTNHARMLSGRQVGSLLHHIILMLAPKRVLELGVFTGYSSICIASALREGALLDSIEINDELEDLIREGFARAGVSERINLIFGDAGALIPGLDATYDLAYIDANKREYALYYREVIDKVRSGGYIIADNVLWDGKVYDGCGACDPQTRGIAEFNRIVAQDDRVENFILPLRDGLNIIRKK